MSMLHKLGWILAGMLFGIVFGISQVIPVTAYMYSGDETEKLEENENADSFEQQFEQQTLDSLDQKHSEIWRKMDSHIDGISFGELVREVIVSGGHLEPKQVFSKLLEQLKEALIEYRDGFVQLFVLGVLSAVFVDSSSALIRNYVGEVGYYAIYSVMLMLLLKSFQTAYDIAMDSVNMDLQTAKVLLPVFVSALVFSGNANTGVGAYSLVLSSIGLVEWLVIHIFFPVAYFYFALLMLNYSLKEDRFSRLANFIKQVMVWVLRLVFGIVTGLQIVQCLFTPASDTARNSNFSKSLATIPGLGASARALTTTLLQSATVVKNAVGIAAMIVLLLVVLTPVIQLIAFILSYQFLAAILQPVANRRITGLVNAFASSIKLLLQGLVTSVALFTVCIAIVTAATTKGG